MSEQERPSDATDVDFKKYASGIRATAVAQRAAQRRDKRGDSANLSDAPDDAGAAQVRGYSRAASITERDRSTLC